MQDTLIEAPTISDIESLIDIAGECGLSPWSHQNYVDELARDDSILLIVRKGSVELAGFVVGRIVRADSAAEIYNIAVTREFQGKGVGAALLGEFVKQCKKAGMARIWLEVRSLNATAMDFYKKKGFQARSTRKNFYRAPSDDAVVMDLDILDESAQ